MHTHCVRVTVASHHKTVQCSEVGSSRGQVIKRTPKRVYQRIIYTSDGQRMNWPPKALQNQLTSEELSKLPTLTAQPHK